MIFNNLWNTMVQFTGTIITTFICIISISYLCGFVQGYFNTSTNKPVNNYGQNSNGQNSNGQNSNDNFNSRIQKANFCGKNLASIVMLLPIMIPYMKYDEKTSSYIYECEYVRKNTMTNFSNKQNL